MPKRYRVLLCFLLPAVIGAAALTATALAQDSAEPASGGDSSFASVFFITYHTDVNGETSVELVGSLIIWLLMAMSVVNVSLIGRLALTNQRKSIVPEGVVKEVRRLLSTGDFRQALTLTQKDQSFFSQVLHAGLKEANYGLAAIIRSLEQTADMLVTIRMRPVEHLYMLGQISPMIGLFGTVYGIIYSFRAFVSIGAHASPAVLAGGIGTALVATFWGLLVAIPALAGYAMIRNRIDQLTLEAMVSAEEMFSQFRPKPTSSERVRAAAGGAESASTQAAP